MTITNDLLQAAIEARASAHPGGIVARHKWVVPFILGWRAAESGLPADACGLITGQADWCAGWQACKQTAAGVR